MTDPDDGRDPIESLGYHGPKARHRRSMQGVDLAAWRKERGLTQESVAEALGISVRTVIRWEQLGTELPAEMEAKLASVALSGKRRTPDIDPLKRIIDLETRVTALENLAGSLD